MGLYPIDCPQCKQPHIWFSGTMDQRCGNCRNPKEWELIQGENHIALLTLADGPKVESGTRVKVIEKSAFDFQCKQVNEIADSFNKSVQYYQGIVKELQSQLLTEKAEVGRLLALNKRRTKS